MAADAALTPPAEPGTWAGLINLQDPAAVQSLAGNVFLAVVVMLLLTGLYRLAPRVWKAIEESIFSNWRLGLLGATGLVLSLASGWTTWDGMRNFTQEPLLSGMITFGIQGVMLIIAWLIGESFATGMSQRPAGAPRGTLSKGFQAGAGGVVGILLFVSVSALFLQSSGSSNPITGGPAAFDPWQMTDKLLILVVGLLLSALVALYSASDVVKPYLQSSRVIAKNTLLWVMFLACMATSVFFSFDSLFSQIFPKAERQRAADLRAQNQVAGIVSDIGATIETRRLGAADELFHSEGWLSYEEQLDRLTVASRGAEKLIEAYYVEQMEERRRGIAEQQERIATAESSQAGLSIKKATLTEELSRLEAERPALVADLQQKKSELDARAKEVDAKRVEAMAEEKGVEGTLKEGRGPIYRQRMEELGKLRDYYKIGEQRVKDAQSRVGDVNGRIDQIKRELAGIDGSLAKLKGESDTAQQRIAAATATSAESEAAPKIDPARVLPEFEAARIDFRQKPDVAGLQNVQEQCTQLLTAMTSTPSTKERVRGIDCDPKRAQEAAGVLFALNSGAKLFGQNCAGGEKLSANAGADALFAFSRRCLADSGLPSQETEQLRTKINFIELNRDDKAHRFVVTWNAFQDGNRLAYLALAIAIAIDGLIFMSGLFGANAVRSPLSDVPSYKARSAQQLEAIIENALLPDTFENARITLQSLRPITNAEGFMAEVRPDRLDPHSAERVIAVLNAGTTIHAVEYDREEDRYLVRAELFEFLSTASKKAFDASEHHATLADLEKIVGVSLLPDIATNVDIVLSHVHPISEKHGFTAEVKLSEVEDAHKRIVRNLLNAGAVHQRVQRSTDAADHYFIHRDLYKTLALIRARSLYSASTTAYRLDKPVNAEAPVFGGSLNPTPQAIAHHPSDQPAGSSGDESNFDQYVGVETELPNEQADQPAYEPAEDVAYAAAEHAQEQTYAERAAVRQRLLMAMGIAPSAYADLVRSEALPEANLAADQLRRICRQHRPLGAHIETDIAELRADLDRAADGLKHEQHRPELVEYVRHEVLSILPALLLVQGGRYQDILNKFIDQLELHDGEGHLDSKGRQLLSRLKYHESALSKIPRDERHDWKRVAYLLEDFGGSESRSDFDSDSETERRRPN